MAEKYIFLQGLQDTEGQTMFEKKWEGDIWCYSSKAIKRNIKFGWRAFKLNFEVAMSVLKPPVPGLTPVTGFPEM
jgi:hypothetical protein